MKAMDDLMTRETALNEALRQGRLLEAYSTFYHEGARHHPVGIHDGDASSAALRFFEWADTFVGAVPVRTMAGDQVSCSEWRGAWSSGREAGFPGSRVVARLWRDGKVVRERVTRRPASHVRPMGVPKAPVQPLRIAAPS
jgi:hypothetical protein